MNEQVMEVKWIEEGYDAERGAYVLGYYVDGVRQCTMWGYRKPNGNVYRVYPRKLARFGYAFPKVREISVFDVKSE